MSGEDEMPLRGKIAGGGFVEENSMLGDEMWRLTVYKVLPVCTLLRSPSTADVLPTERRL